MLNSSLSLTSTSFPRPKTSPSTFFRPPTLSNLKSPPTTDLGSEMMHGKSCGRTCLRTTTVEGNLSRAQPATTTLRQPLPPSRVDFSAPTPSSLAPSPPLNPKVLHRIIVAISRLLLPPPSSAQLASLLAVIVERTKLLSDQPSSSVASNSILRLPPAAKTSEEDPTPSSSSRQL